MVEQITAGIDTSMFFRSGYIPSFLGSNIEVVEWLPQNDLLAHKDIKAFVSHVGHDSLYEPAYHEVPLVAFPLFADKYANAKKGEHFGLGLMVDHRSTGAQQLFETIELVISEPRYMYLLFYPGSVVSAWSLPLC